MLRMPVGLYEKALPPELSWEERLAAAGEAGYDYIDISIDESDERLARLDWTAQQRAALRQAIANTGVQVSTMCLSAHRKYALGSRDSQTRKQGQEILYKAIDLGVDIGLRVVQVMAYDVFYEESDEGTKARFMEGLELGTRLASQAAMMLGLENLDTPFVENASQGLAVINAIDSPWLRLYLDMGNLAAAGYSPPDELRLTQGKLLGIHVKDAAPKVIRGIPFGQGIVPFRETFRALAEIGFWGMLGVEMWGYMHTDVDPVESAAAARRFVAELVAEAWADDRRVKSVKVLDQAPYSS
jgi:predicted hexulose-6-phosphate isomerase